MTTEISELEQQNYELEQENDELNKYIDALEMLVKRTSAIAGSICVEIGQFHNE